MRGPDQAWRSPFSYVETAQRVPDTVLPKAKFNGLLDSGHSFEDVREHHSEGSVAGWMWPLLRSDR